MALGWMRAAGRRGVGLVLLGAAVAAPTSCKKSSSSVAGVSVRFVNAALGLGSVDLYIQETGARFGTDLAEAASTGYFDFERESFVFEIREAGSPFNSAPLLVSDPIEFDGTDPVTLLLAGDPNSTAPDTTVRLLTIIEEFSAPTFPLARLRVVNAAHDSAGLALDFLQDGSFEIEGLARFETTPPDGNDFLPADTALDVTVGDGSPIVPVDDFSFDVLGDTDRLFLVAAGRVQAPPGAPDVLRFLLLDQGGVRAVVGTDPRVYVMTVSANTPSMRVEIDGSVVNPASGFGALSGPFQVAPGAHTLEFFNGPTSVGQFTFPELETGTVTLALAAGDASGLNPTDQAFAVSFEPLLLQGDITSASVQAMYAGADAQPVDVGQEAGGELVPPLLFPGLSFLESSVEEGLLIPPGLDTYGIAPGGTTTASFTFDVTVAADMRSLWIFAGSFTGQGGQSAFQMFQLITNTDPWTLQSIPSN